MMPAIPSGTLEAVVVLSVGTALVVALAAAAQRTARTAVWQRTLWQAAVIGLLGLAFIELSGTGPATVGLCRAKWSGGQPGDCPDFREAKMGLSPSRPPRPLVPKLRLGNPPGQQQTVSEQGFPSWSLGTRATGRSPSHRLNWWLGVIWALGTAFLAARAAWSRLLLWRFRRRGTSVTDSMLRQSVARLSKRLRINRPVALLEAAGLRAPVAFGTFRPVVALPQGFAESFDHCQQEAMLAHELAHLAAGDSAWQLASDAACAILWWHPMAWWSRARLRAASEVAADEASLLIPGGPDVLAGCLVTLGRRLVGRRRLGWLSVEGPGFRSGLGRRVYRLLNMPGRPRRAPGGRTLAAAKFVVPAVMVAAAISCTAWARPQADLAEGETTMNVLKNAFGRSFAAAAVAALLGPVSSDALADRPPDGVPKPDEVRRRGDDPPRDAHRKDRDGPKRDADEPRRDKPQPWPMEAERRQRAPQKDPDAHHRKMEEVAHKLMREREELEEIAARIERELAGLRDDQDDEAFKLKRELDRVHVEREKIERMLRDLGDEPMRRPPVGPPDSWRFDREQREIVQRLEELKRKYGPEHPKVRMEVERLEALERFREAADPGADVQRRMQHLKAAVDNLHEAGLHEQAERLMHEAEHFLRQAGEPDGRHPGPPEHRDRPPHPPEELEGVVRELHGQMERLHREMDEMRRHLGRIHDRFEHDDDDDEDDDDDDDD